MKTTILAISLISFVCAATLAGEARAKAQRQRGASKLGPIPKWFFSPQKVTPDHYGEKWLHDKLKVEFRVKADSAIAAEKIANPLIAKKLVKAGFGLMDERKVRELRVWRGLKPKATALENFGQSFAAPKVLYTCEDEKSFLAAFGAIVFLHDRRHGTVSGSVRQIVLEVRSTPIFFHDGFLSMSIEITVKIVGALRWEDGYIKEDVLDLTQDQFADVAKLLAQLSAEMKTLDRELGISETKTATSSL